MYWMRGGCGRVIGLDGELDLCCDRFLKFEFLRIVKYSKNFKIGINSKFKKPLQIQNVKKYIKFKKIFKTKKFLKNLAIDYKNHPKTY